MYLEIHRWKHVSRSFRFNPSCSCTWDNLPANTPRATRSRCDPWHAVPVVPPPTTPAPPRRSSRRTAHPAATTAAADPAAWVLSGAPSCTGPNGAQRRGACGRRNLDADRDIRGIVPGPRCGTGGAAAGRSTTAPPDIAAGRTPIRRTVQRDRRWLRRPRRPGGHLAQVRRLAAAHRGFDLPRLAALPEREAGPLARYASAIRSQREDDDRDALTMRERSRGRWRWCMTGLSAT